MLEIRTDQDSRRATPDGPHDNEQTRAIAAAISEAARLLNHATMHSQGLRYPSDVYSVLGTLSGAMYALPQTLRQMTAWIADEVAQGGAREHPGYGDHSGDAAAAVAALRVQMGAAINLAEALAKTLGAGQGTMRGMESTRDE